MNTEEIAAAMIAGGSLYSQRRYQEALPYFTQVIEADPTIPEAWCGRGITYLSLHQLEPALHDIDRALAMFKPTDSEVDRNALFMLLYSRALALDGVHRAEEARAAFAMAASVSHLPASGFARWGDLARLAGRREEAVAAYNQAIDDDISREGSPDTYVKVAQALMELHHNATALNIAHTIVQRFPENIGGWKAEARALLALKRYHESLESAERALTMDGQDDYAWGVKGAALQGLKRYRAAQEAYHQSYTLMFTNPQERQIAFRGDLQMLLRTWQWRTAWRLVNMEMGQRLHEGQIYR